MLVSLPPELLSLALDGLPLSDLLNCRLLCRSINQLIDTSSSLSYRIDLALAGLEDGLSSHLALGPKREMLARHQRAHHTLSSGVVSINNDPDLAKYPCILSDAVLVLRVDDSLAKLENLPSVIRGIPERIWEFRVDFVLGHMVVDWARDLVVALDEFEELGMVLRFISIATGGVHPSAINGMVVLVGVPQRSLDEMRCQLIICDSLLGVVTRPDDIPELEYCQVLNWKTGFVAELPSQMGVKSLSFLDDRHALLLTAPIFDILSFSIVDCSEEAHDPNYVFVLPSLSPDVTIEELAIHCDPLPAWEPPPLTNPPFRVSRTNRIIVIEVTLHYPDQLASGDEQQDVVGTIRFVIPNWVLRSHVDKHHDAQEGVDIGWNEWGPTGCRVFYYESDPMPCSTYGTKYASRSPDGFLEIFEFHKFAVRRFETLGSWEQGVECELVKESTEIQSRAFVDPVSSSLPYLKYTTQLQVPDGTDVALSEDSFLLSSSDSVSIVSL